MTSSYDKIKKEAEITGPHGCIQWEGTNVCIDLHCSCGKLSHIDADFAYYFRCSCGKLWGLSPWIKLVEFTDDDIKNTHHSCVKEDINDSLF